LAEARLLKFWIDPAQIIAGEFCRSLHAPRQQPPA
jgi:hypothetical protein